MLEKTLIITCMASCWLGVAVGYALAKVGTTTPREIVPMDPISEYDTPQML
jgi:hypothetical protein